MGDLLKEFRASARDDRHLLILVGLLWATLIALLASKGINALKPASYVSNLAIYLSTLLFVGAFHMGRLLLRHRPESPISFLYSVAKEKRLAHWLMRGLPMLLAITIFIPAFSATKSAIPLFNDYTWDSTWDALDVTLHGARPWELLQPLIGYPLITSAFSIAYHLWVMLIYIGGVYFAFTHTDRELRARFFFCFFLCWAVIGVLLATVLASVGPCFVGPLLGDHSYDAQMTYLRAANEEYPLMVLGVQERLLEWYQAGNHGLGRGISAMPSMHVSIAFLSFLVATRISKRLAVALGLFCVIVMIGSVHLAYHYAVDGYVALIVTGAIWLASAPFARWAVGKQGIGEAPIPVAA